MVESYNQQHRSRWVISHLHILSVQLRVYTDYELREARERRILTKSRYCELLEQFELPKSTLRITLNVPFPPLKCSSMKHLWDLIEVGKITKKTVREVITLTVVKNSPGPKNCLIKEKEVYIAET